MKLFYKPFGIIAGIVAGIVARKIFTFVWSKIDDQEPPEAKTAAASWPRVLAAQTLQGAVFSGTRAVVDRAGARGFEHLFGIWPGEQAADKA
jgi:hypothetical protein